MPEGHTLHRLALALGEAFAGHRVRVSSPQGRFAESAALLDGREVDSAQAYGKHLFVGFDGDPAHDLVHVHLGLYGRFDVHRDVSEVPEPVGQVRLRLAGGGSYADLRGAPACELVTPAERDAVVKRLGPDPLRAGSDPDVAWQRIRHSRAPIGGLLMDQRVVAGIGNVYRAELLFRHRIDPLRPGRSLRARQWQDLWADLVDLMGEGVLSGLIDTVRPEHLTEEEMDARPLRAGSRRGHSYVYRRAGAPCRVCGSRVRTLVLQGRNLYWCGTCQRRYRGSA